ncbi:RpiB/LacA/LacB family sugar-phosphate isomerase [Variovorax sp. KK3]|uniref:RpiB/LacA/LacB family sugar-phosphate isomerase n=1 Tax=Variovorax sp. KK3 TaxID=1855728 RepID=UPI00097C89E8|nr:RpiB/LacA/LacB family sugar-phosphate isomerase [Variovorax sp. KK3]
MSRDEARSPHALEVPRWPAIGLANDHAGFLLKAFVFGVLAQHCDQVIDVGVMSDAPVDFPDVTRKAISLIQEGTVKRVVLVCGTGAGACIAANKIPGIRAAVCHDTFVARQAVEHDDVNVLCIGAWIVGPQVARDVIETFLASAFSTEEHFRRRVDKLGDLEREAAQALVEGRRFP